MSKAEFQLEPLTCPSCIKKIEGTLRKMEGIQDARVLFNSSKVKVSFDEATLQIEEISNRIERLGYEILS